MLQFTIESCAESRRAEFTDLLCHHALPLIIQRWVGPERRFELLGGTDDSGSERRVYVILHDDCAEVACAFASADEVLREYPEAKRLIPPPLCERAYSTPENCLPKAERDYQSLCRKHLGENYHEELVSDVTTFERLIPYILGIALSEHGEINIRYLDYEFLDDIEDADAIIAQHLSVDALRANPKTQTASEHQFYVRRDVPQSDVSLQIAM